MKNMTIQELYDYLNSPEFQKADGNIFYNYYIYQYPASDEYKMRRQIVEFKQNLERPSSFVNAMSLDLFSVFCDYLRSESFGDVSLLEDTLEEDRTNPDSVTQELTTEANSDAFIKFVNDRIIGLTHEEIRERSHNPMKFYSIKQMVLPDYSFGKVYALLNELRTAVRETEVAAVRAFRRQTVYERRDIVETLNRLSSVMHIMMCMYLADEYKK